MVQFTTTINLDKQSVEVPGSKTPGATAIYRHPNGYVDHCHEAPHAKTVYDLFQHAVSKFSSNDFLGTRTYDPSTKKYGAYSWQTYGQVHDRIEAFGSGLIHVYEKILGNTQLKRWSLGIWAQSRPEWFISDLSCSFFDMVSVPLYETLGSDSVEYVCNHAEIKVVVCSANHIPKLLASADKLPFLQGIVSMDSIDESTRSAGDKKGIKIFDFSEIETLGKKFPRKHSPPQESDVNTICYTSGTTGQPKGAMLTHKNFVAAVGGARESLKLTPEDTMISYLPLAHIMGRFTDTMTLFGGAKIGYFHGDMLALLDDAMELKPTYFPAVPRLLNRIYAKVAASTIQAPGPLGAISRHAVNEKVANLEAGKGFRHELWDPLLFEHVRQVLGGRVQVILTGSAPISKEVLSFLRVAFCCVVLEGYGATESMATISVTSCADYIPGHVGGPRAVVELRLVDVPEMNYLTTDKPFPRGEIQTRGANMFVGYYKDEKNTNATILPGGWVASGDIGFIDNRGCLTIVDRKKNIFKLAQGEYVAPEKIENVLTARCKLVMQMFVHGDSLESSLVAVSVPDPDTFLPWANSIANSQIKASDSEGLSKLCNDPRILNAFLKELEAAGRAGGLNGFELPKKVHLTFDAFSVENDILTPTSKLRRPQAKAYFQDKIDIMYNELRATQPVAKL
ncbi:hypothetical protein BGZ80_010413 [Entomortierella chlamydospora]|uniref:AMP-dependent synthetase/ligase domain-containing protein n=1 Tax=Entomortierella chlamydospora TaxID=101097 RepID=A0A9P6MVX3_9FUNG|nr:hypothetical protein BGZ79_008699 [Entomortierella chlamydospora]KAG0014493.1 hypothetical protein BGZ80_010413 [Entomortierella chlamydospora]